MVIFGMVGDMGAGKTLGATYLGWKNWFSRNMKIYSNYHLYKVPYCYIRTVKQLDFMHEGVALLDEMWRIVDSRMSRKASNKFVSDILARSRKRRLVYIFTAQVIDSIDKRIRKVMDFTCLPVLMGKYEQECKCLIFRTGFIKNLSNYMKTFYFRTEIPMICYDSEEEVDMEEDTYEDGEVEQPRIMWQEAKARCRKCGELVTMGWECPACDSKDVEAIEPIYFENWEDADKFAQRYWEKKLEEMNIVSTEREG